MQPMNGGRPGRLLGYGMVHQQHYLQYELSTGTLIQNIIYLQTYLPYPRLLPSPHLMWLDSVCPIRPCKSNLRRQLPLSSYLQRYAQQPSRFPQTLPLSPSRLQYRSE